MNPPFAPAARVVVISGPSGVGKGTICQRLLARFPGQLALSVSATTRAPRAGEIDGTDYHFLSESSFKDSIAAGGFLEWACYNGHYYGTPLDRIQARLAAGTHVLLEIDVQGALQVKARLPESACLVFIAPPSFEALAERLQGRGTNDAADIAARLAISRDELAQQAAFDHVVVNADLDTCCQELGAYLAPVLGLPAPAHHWDYPPLSTL